MVITMTQCKTCTSTKTEEYIAMIEDFKPQATNSDLQIRVVVNENPIVWKSENSVFYCVQCAAGLGHYLKLFGIQLVTK